MKRLFLLFLLISAVSSANENGTYNDVPNSSSAIGSGEIAKINIVLDCAESKAETKLETRIIHFWVPADGGIEKETGKGLGRSSRYIAINGFSESSHKNSGKLFMNRDGFIIAEKNSNQVAFAKIDNINFCDSENRKTFTTSATVLSGRLSFINKGTAELDCFKEYRRIGVCLDQVDYYIHDQNLEIIVNN